jgi:hypothetical protein
MKRGMQEGWRGGGGRRMMRAGIAANGKAMGGLTNLGAIQTVLPIDCTINILYYHVNILYY